MAIRRSRWLALLTFLLIASACADGFESQAPLTVDPPADDRPVGEPVLTVSSDGITAELFVLGECGTLFTVGQRHSERIDFCPPMWPAFGGVQSTDCLGAMGQGGCEGETLPVFHASRTHPDAAWSCTDGSGRHPVIEGWWLTLGGGGHEVFPLNADGVRLDPLANEMSDTTRAVCDIVDPEVGPVTIEFVYTGDSSGSVELDAGAYGFFPVSGGGSTRVDAMLPTHDTDIHVALYVGNSGKGIGTVSTSGRPDCEGPVFVINVDAVTSEWVCE